MINLSTVLGNIVKSIVDHPDKVVITEHTEGDEVLLTLTVAFDSVLKSSKSQDMNTKPISDTKNKSEKNLLNAFILFVN